MIQTFKIFCDNLKAFSCILVQLKSDERGREMGKARGRDDEREESVRNYERDGEGEKERDDRR